MYALGLGATNKEITGKLIEAVKKKPATLLNIHHFTSIFQGISLGLKQFFVAVYKDWSGKYNTFKN